jgi:hypothetical protein
MDTGGLFPEVKRPGSEADHSPPTSAEVKKTWICTSTPPTRLHGVVMAGLLMIRMYDMDTRMLLLNQQFPMSMLSYGNLTADIPDSTDLNKFQHPLYSYVILQPQYIPYQSNRYYTCMSVERLTYLLMYNQRNIVT